MANPHFTVTSDAESRDWLASLRSSGRARDDAIAELHRLLLAAARFEARRRRARMPPISDVDLDEIVLESADDAVAAVLRKLDDFRGESRFTTWAYKFALLEVAVKMRRRAWRDREVLLDSERWPLVEDSRPLPEDDAERGELLVALGRMIEHSLTPLQRRVLVALALNEVPIDVLAERMDTSRGALYKVLHDARKKLRTELGAAGFDVAPTKEGQRT